MTSATTKTPFASSPSSARRAGAQDKLGCGQDEMPNRQVLDQGVSSSLDTNGIRQDFPSIRNWHYLDTAATAQKPQAMLTERALTKLGELV